MSTRALGRACIALLVVSTAFPIAASVRFGHPPVRWLGITDVTVAAVLVVVLMVVGARTRGMVDDGHRLAAIRRGQIVLGVIPLLLALYFVGGQRVDWTVLVIGLAWRGWLLLYSLPYLVAALERGERG